MSVNEAKAGSCKFKREVEWLDGRRPWVMDKKSEVKGIVVWIRMGHTKNP